MVDVVLVYESDEVCDTDGVMPDAVLSYQPYNKNPYELYFRFSDEEYEKLIYLHADYTKEANPIVRLKGMRLGAYGETPVLGDMTVSLDGLKSVSILPQPAQAQHDPANW